MKIISKRVLPPIRAVLFDMDGLLIDSESISQRCIMQALLDLGFSNASEEVCRLMLGRTDRDCMRILADAFPGFSEPEFRHRCDELTYAMFETDLRAKKGAFELLDYLRQRDVPYAVASSSTAPRVELSLRLTGLDALCPIRITGDRVAHAKPAPDIFLIAAETIGVPPENCLVLEDSLNGVRSGRAANTVCCMVPDLLPFSEAFTPFCDLLADSLLEIPQLINP